MSDLGAEGPVLTKVCPHCSVQSTTSGSFCPNCGKAFATRRPSAGTKRAVAASIAVLAVILGTAAVVTKVSHDHKAAAAEASAQASARASADAKAAAAKQASEQAELRAQQRATARAKKRASDRAARQVRQLLVKDLQKSVTKDARGDVAKGVLTGPILNTQCTPVGGGSADDLTAVTGKFECLAVNKDNGDGTVSGYNFLATVTWKDFSYTWHLDT